MGALQTGAEEQNLCRGIWLRSAVHRTDKLEAGTSAKGLSQQVPERDLQTNWNGLWLEVPGQPVYKMECLMMAMHTHRPMHKDMDNVTLRPRHKL